MQASLNLNRRFHFYLLISKPSTQDSLYDPAALAKPREKIKLARRWSKKKREEEEEEEEEGKDRVRDGT